MTKQEFLTQLGKALYTLPYDDREDILQDYRDHFRSGEEMGQTEEEIAAALGDPAALGRTYIDGTGAQENPLGETDPPPRPGPTPPPGGAVYPPPPYAPSANNGNKTAITIGVILFNVLIGVWVLFGLACAVFSLWFAPVSIFAAGVGLFILGFTFTGLSAAALILFGIALCALAVLFGIGLYLLCKYFCIGVKYYIDACTKLCKEGKL